MCMVLRAGFTSADPALHSVAEEIPSEPDSQTVEKALDWTEGVLVQGRDHARYVSSSEQTNLSRGAKAILGAGAGEFLSGDLLEIKISQVHVPIRQDVHGENILAFFEMNFEKLRR